MKKFLLLVSLPILAFAENIQISDEQIQQYIFISTNAEKCFQSGVWTAKTNREREQDFVKRSEFENVIESKYDIALMTELFGSDATVKIFEDNDFAKDFNERRYKFSYQKNTILSQKECDDLSNYLLNLTKKHIN
ncbi:hypothetical protein [Actinobacillus capsulatus]|uniref:hypothetical protein n=1 Tax=Actinobacillus capsulatus TaxID=717 RepID=UPI00036ED4B8|nr:hypothetical protein [Actinobacillus capsulatus]